MNDLALVDVARALGGVDHLPPRHAVGAAVLTEQGRLYRGVHLETAVGRAAICAEAVAIGAALTDDGGARIARIVAVRLATGEVVAPCGLCRELLADYGPDAVVLLPGAEGPTEAKIAELLPHRFRRVGEASEGA